MNRLYKSGLAALAATALMAVCGEAAHLRAEEVTYTGTNNGTEFSITIDYSGDSAVVVGGYYGANSIVTTLLGVSQFDNRYADFDIWPPAPLPPDVPSPSPVSAGYFSDAAGNVVTPTKGKPFYIRFR